MSAGTSLVIFCLSAACGLALGHAAGYSRGQRDMARAAHLIRRAVEGARR